MTKLYICGRTNLLLVLHLQLIKKDCYLKFIDKDWTLKKRNFICQENEVYMRYINKTATLKKTIKEH